MTTTNKASHTPGPWRIRQTVEGGSQFQILDPGYDPAIAWHEPMATVRGEANAHLIAAAPELLEAAEFLLDAIVALAGWGGEEMLATAREKARAAIAAARREA